MSEMAPNKNGGSRMETYKVAEKVDEAAVEDLDLTGRIVFFALRDLGPEGMTGDDVEAIERWVCRAETIQSMLTLAQEGLVVAFVRPNGEVAFRSPRLPGVGGPPPGTTPDRQYQAADL
jgi:hypothetical protein